MGQEGKRPRWEGGKCWGGRKQTYALCTEQKEREPFSGGTEVEIASTQCRRTELKTRVIQNPSDRDTEEEKRMLCPRDRNGRRHPGTARSANKGLPQGN